MRNEIEYDEDDTEFNKKYNAIVREVTERFVDDFEQLTDKAKPLRMKHKEKLIKLVALIYRDNIQNFPPNILFSIIEEILEGN